MKPKLTLPKKSAFAAVLFIGMLVFAEIALRLGLALGGVSYSGMREFNRKWTDASKQGYYEKYEDAYPYLPYRVRPDVRGGDYSNDKGYRGVPFEWESDDSVFRIACLGGSTTWEGAYPDAMEAFLNEASEAGQTDEETRFEVLNFGAESWTSVESLINYAVRGVHADLDAVVVYHAVNDVVAATHPPEIKPEPDYSHWRTRLKKPPSSLMNFVPLCFDGSCLVGSIRYAIGKSKAVDEWTTAMRNYPFDPNHEFQGPGTFRQNINSIVSIALGNGTKVYLTTQIHSENWSREMCGNGAGAKRTALMNDALREVARQYAGRNDVLLIDAAAQAGKLGLEEEMTDWCHFTPEGYQRLGEFIAGKILEDLE